MQLETTQQAETRWKRQERERAFYFSWIEMAKGIQRQAEMRKLQVIADMLKNNKIVIIPHDHGGFDFWLNQTCITIH